MMKPDNYCYVDWLEHWVNFVFAFLHKFSYLEIVECPFCVMNVLNAFGRFWIGSFFFSNSCHFFFLCLSILSSKFIIDKSFLFLFLLFKFFLLLNNSLSYLNCLQLLQLIYTTYFLSQMPNQSCYVFVWPELSPIAYCHSAQRTFFFTLSVVSFNTIWTKSVHAGSVNHWVADQLLANRTSQIFHHTFYKLFADAVV